jgi:hypothetical protein
MPRTTTGRALALAVAFITGGLTLTAQAHALTQKPVWKCRASAGYTAVNGGDRAEAVVANGNVNTARGQDPDHALCGRGESGGGNLPAPLGIPKDLLATSSASAVTTVSPELGAARDQRVGALGRVENFLLQFPGAGSVVLGVTFAEATATGACRGGTPQMTGASRVAGLTVNNMAVDPFMLAPRLTDAMASLNPSVDVKQDEMIRTADGLTIRALHIVVRLGSGGVIDTVIAEAKVGTDGPVCSNDVSDPPVDRNRGPCPRGTVYDAARNLCFIRGGTGGSGLGDIVVGSPGSSGLGDSDGSYLAADVALRRYPKSPCRPPSTVKFVIVGTNKSNILQGTKRADRIIALGGSDRVTATRGGDCVDGGRGNDQLSGDVGNDAIYGGTGNDRINGGPGNDKIHGGRGNDTINAAFGTDRIWGDAGNDYINIATAGPPASADCGRGYDTIRHNANERKRVKACEKKGD